jgi:hypothetical protein
MKVMMKGLVLAIAVALLTATSAHATMVAWYRMGDDDGGLAVPPVNGGNIGPGDAENQKTVNHSTQVGAWGGLYFSGATPQYSTTVPGTGVATEIYDPISDTTLPNNWSMHTPGTNTSERIRPGVVSIPSSFTFEAFVQPVSGTNGTGGMAFAYHRQSMVNGWDLGRTSGGALTVSLYEGSTTVNTITSAAGLLTNDEWHHVAVVYQNLPDEDGNDFFLYLDNNLVAEGNGTVALGGNVNFFLGNATASGGRKIFIDEARYFANETLIPEQFLQVVPEPNALILASIGVVGLAGYRVRRRNAKA